MTNRELHEPLTTPSVTNCALPVESHGSVPARFVQAPTEHAVLVLAPGAGVTMDHEFIVEITERLAAEGISTLTFNFPYMQSISQQPNTTPTLHRTLRAAVAHARVLRPSASLYLGGRGFGSRVVAEAFAKDPIEGVEGLAFLGYSLHSSRSPSDARADHLRRIRTPMLFVLGTRDEVAHAGIVTNLVEELGANAAVRWIEGADQSFRVPALGRNGERRRTANVARCVIDWIADNAQRRPLP